jgi:hypothetical protein
VASSGQEATVSGSALAEGYTNVGVGPGVMKGANLIGSKSKIGWPKVLRIESATTRSSMEQVHL